MQTTPATEAARMTLRAPSLGDTIHVHGRPAIVRRLLPAGTVEVERDDGRWFRLSGFALEAGR